MGLRIYLAMLVASLLAAQPRVPRVWDEKGFAGWQLPIVGQKFTGGHFTEEEYYRAPVENIRTYPVYAPGREPKGYWDFLNSVGGGGTGRNGRTCSWMA